MRRTFKSIALLCMGLVAISCIEENLDPNKGYYDTTSGNDIVFSATAQIESGDAKGRTRTVYGGVGDVNDDGINDMIDINWSQGDKIQIASLEAAGTQKAEYIVGFEAKDENYTGSHTATSLTKTGDVALQWSEANNYNFYAMYPSSASFATEEEQANVSLTVSDDEKVMYGWIPTAQLNENHTAPKTGSHVIEPNMKYAYMHAASSYAKYDEQGKENTAGISLQFMSAVTALQFDITANTVAQQSDAGQYVTIKSVTLRSKSGLDISGKFKYDFVSGKYSVANTSTGYAYTTMSFGGGYTLQPQESLDVTFFILPQNIPAGDLQIQIMFSIGGREQIVVRTATLKNAITACKKYSYKDLLMPAIEADFNGSNWVSALDPNTYLTQISVPVAGNAFSSYYTGDSQQYNREQVHNYQTLWNMGVRGFEFKTAQGYNPANNSSGRNYTRTNTVANEYFVTNGQEMTGGPTFDTAFTYLAQQLLDERYNEEFLVIIATYQSYTGCGAYDPQQYVDDLEAYFRNKEVSYTDPNTGTAVKKHVWNDDMIVKLSSNSVVGDLKGKIAVVVRPADNEFIKYANLSYESLTYASDTKLMYVDNWGTSVDCWDRRFSGYNRQMVFGQGSADTYIENYLYAIASNNSGDTPETTGERTSAFKEEYPATNTPTDGLFTFNNGGYFIQEFARVAPVNTKINSGFYGNVSDSYGGFLGYGGTYRYLWVRWPESYTEKANMIDYTLSKSMSTIGATSATPLFINSLAGYYVTQNHKQSYLPYAGQYTYEGLEFSCSDAGMGGDIAGLAGDLNTYLYNKLLDAEKNHQQGPLGLIIMNYIGAADEDFAKSDYNDEKGATWAINAETASSALPNMILMNNFKFPLTTKCQVCGNYPCTCDNTPQQTSFNAKYVDGGEAISFE